MGFWCLLNFKSVHIHYIVPYPTENYNSDFTMVSHDFFQIFRRFDHMMQVFPGCGEKLRETKNN